MVQYDYSDKFSFLAEWCDHDIQFHKNFILNYFPADNTLELFDKDVNRMYLRRTFVDGITIDDIYVHNEIRIYGRSITILDYADLRTKNRFGKSRIHTFAMIKPSAIDKLGTVFNEIEKRKFQIVKARKCQLNQEEALDFYSSKKGDPFLPFMVEHLSSGPIIALDLVGDDAIERWQKELGPIDPQEARRTAPETLRALYGCDKAGNGFHAAVDCEAVLREIEFFFPQKAKCKGLTVDLKLTNSTCCVIKPHAIRDGSLGCILSDITSDKYQINAMQTFYLDRTSAEEFLEVYKTVVSDYFALVSSFLDGPCLAMEVIGKEGISKEERDVDDIHGEFRKFVGPSDSDIARQIRPGTLRAKYGIDKWRNAVHCTDLVDDTRLELEYFFKILS